MSTTTTVSSRVWVLENEVPVCYYGVLYIHRKELFYCIFDPHIPIAIKRLPASLVYETEKECRASLANIDCWYIEQNTIVPAKGYRAAGGNLVAFDVLTNRRVDQRDIFSDHSKAQNWLLLQRRNEKRSKLRSK